MATKKSGRLYIIGAGFAGQALANEIKTKAIFGELVAFLDDDPEVMGRKIDGIPVLGPIKDVARLLRMNPADEAIIAMPGASREYIKEIYGILKRAGFERIRILPGMSQSIEGDARLIQTRSIDPQDLLGRTPVAVNIRQSLAYLRGKRVLVTGAGGSIGSELCRQLLSGGVSRLYLLGHGENSIYQIDRELRLLQEEGVGEKTTLIPIIGDLKDRDYMHFLLARLKADVIFHAAAYKHVPMMEENPVAVIENNFFGTDNLISAARSNGVKRFVLITTDKAVNPVSVYGASKYLCERLVLDAAKKAGLNYMVVRFGNVLGSRGSIMPLFQKQIEKGGPVTITHPEMRRYFMTIPEACSLVLKAGGVGENGKLYLLDMGEPVRIRDMAEQMIRFYGFEPEEDIKIEYIGLRPGERLDEDLWGRDEIPVDTEFKRILRVERKQPVNPDPAFPSPALADEIPAEELLEKLRPIVHFDPEQPTHYRDAVLLRDVLEEVIPSLMPARALAPQGKVYGY
ncbi:capsular polysaccharide biosynthesis protein [Treponema primitia ZAS-2]|uniref:Capsular polysaccharide biosynthesis protein n=1 Tax=Treponema primitia (strain ATCC BAA-887 / DSM 12427 / ZAS-2) TaxID=545694 RepID=F5YHV0_TREPZ|nr:nucleoside-diphosphate sugar epimerase/dehydratase [Treponema primitia]AEF84828.1 capsular polysaccharide biosynthesis protein [Treponema primitia ZAS-2]